MKIFDSVALAKVFKLFSSVLASLRRREWELSAPARACTGACSAHVFFLNFLFFRTYWNCFSARCRVGTACGKHRRCGLSFTRTRSCAIAYPGKVLKYRQTCNFSPFNLYCEIIMHKVLFVEGFIAKRQFVFLCVDKIFNSKYLARWIHWEEM